MAKLINELSRTFCEYLLIPQLTTYDLIPKNVSLSTYITKYSKDTKNDALKINLPMASAAMQAVSDHKLAIALAKEGGISFIYSSQKISDQANMVKKVKSYKAGFIVSESNLKYNSKISEAINIMDETRHSTIPITEDGTPHGKLLGILTDKDIRLSRVSTDEEVGKYMTPFEKLVVEKVGITLQSANDIIWENKINCLPIIDEEQHLQYLSFRKDYDESKKHVNQNVDSEKRLIVGAAINTWDYKERVPALIEAGVDILCIDSSDGYSEYQKDAIKYIKSTFGESVKVGAGNIVYQDAFRYLAEAGADFIKVGIGGGSICITREQKGIGRGQASALVDVASERDKYYNETGIYVPICSDGGITADYQIVLALAMGADFVMQGRFFARFEESPGKKTNVGHNIVKEYWGEGTKRAANWQRYADSSKPDVIFEEGVDSFVPFGGTLANGMNESVAKIKSTMCSCGSKNIEELREKAILTIVSEASINEGSPHDLISKVRV